MPVSSLISWRLSQQRNLAFRIISLLIIQNANVANIPAVSQEI